MQAIPNSSGALDQRSIVPSEEIIDCDGARLEVTLTVPPAAEGVVVLLHACSAGRFAPQSRFTAELFQQAGLATLQADLLCPQEEASSRAAAYHRNSMLVRRLLSIIDWLGELPRTSSLRIGLFASTSELVAALIAAERQPRIRAVVGRGGLPSELDGTLTTLNAPSFFLIGADEQARAAELALEFFTRHLRRRPELPHERVG